MHTRCPLISPQVLCEVPSNIILSKFSKPSYYIGILVVCWGICMTCSGLTQSYAGLLVTRFLIGVFEGRKAVCAAFEPMLT